MDEAVNELVVFLSNPNRKAEAHVDTVMTLVRELSRYQYELAETKKQRDKFDDRLMKASRHETMGFAEDPYRRGYNPRQMQIPEGVRSVEVKF